MAVIKCKLCGSDLTLMPGSCVAQCAYCGNLQVVAAAPAIAQTNPAPPCEKTRPAPRYEDMRKVPPARRRRLEEERLRQENERMLLDAEQAQQAQEQARQEEQARAEARRQAAERRKFFQSLQNRLTASTSVWTYRAACVPYSGKVYLADKRGKISKIVEQWPRVEAVSQCDAHMAALMTDGSMIHTFDVKKRVAGGTAVGAGGLFACGLLQDHTVQLIEESYGNEKPQSWIDIQKISCGMNHIVGLRSNGTACATGDNDNQQIDLSHWRDLVDIDAGYNITLGITQTGRVEMAGVVDYSSLANDLKGWTDVVQVSAGYDHAIGLRSDGSVLVAGQTDNHRGDAAWWRNMIAVCAGYCCCIGIRDDGTILVAGKIKHGRENMEGRNIFEGLDPAQRENMRQRLIDARNNFLKNG